MIIKCRHCGKEFDKASHRNQHEADAHGPLTAAKTQIEALQLRIRELEDVKADNFRMDATITRLVYQLKAEREVLLAEQALSDKLEKALKAVRWQVKKDSDADVIAEAALAEVGRLRSREVATSCSQGK